MHIQHLIKITISCLIFLSCMEANANQIRVVIEKGKSAVSYAMKDPESTKFREITVHKKSSGPYMVCGQINAKNSYGGYIGYQGFMVSVGSGKAVVTLERDKYFPFETVWEAICNIKDQIHPVQTKKK